MGSENIGLREVIRRLFAGSPGGVVADHPRERVRITSGVDIEALSEEIVQVGGEGNQSPPFVDGITDLLVEGDVLRNLPLFTRHGYQSGVYVDAIYNIYAVYAMKRERHYLSRLCILMMVEFVMPHGEKDGPLDHR